jgi:hypothetical protein
MERIFGEDQEADVEPIRQIDIGGKDREGARDEK